MSIDLNQIYKQAYYDVIYEHISRDPPDYELMIGILGDIKNKLCSILKNGSSLRVEIEERIDLDLFKQMLVNDAYSIDDFEQLVSFTFEKCKQLGSAGRDRYTDALLEEIILAKVGGATFASLVVLFIKNINKCIDLLYEDLHNFYKQTDE